MVKNNFPTCFNIIAFALMLLIPSNLLKAEDLTDFFSESNDDGVLLHYGFRGQSVYLTSGEEAYSGVINIPNTVTSPKTNKEVLVRGIWDRAFYQAESLDSVFIPTSVDSIGYESFAKSSLKHIQFSENEKLIIDNYALNDCKNLKVIVFPKSIGFVYRGVLDGCTNLTKIIYPERLCLYYPPIGQYDVFNDDKPLWYDSSMPVSYIKISCNLISMNECNYGIFPCKHENPYDRYDHEYHTMYFPESVKTLEIVGKGLNLSDDNSYFSKYFNNYDKQYFRWDFSSLKTIYSSSISHYRGFEGTLIITEDLNSSIDLERNSIKKIKFKTLNGNLINVTNYNSPLESIELFEGMTNIVSDALREKNNLKELILPSTMQGLGENALYGCSGMEDLYVSSVYPPGAYENTFDGMRFYQCKLHVPYGSKQYYENADGWKRFYHIIEDAPIDNSNKVKVTVEDTNLEVIIDAIENADSYVLKLRDTLTDEEIYNGSQTVSANDEQIVFHVGNLEPKTEYDYYVDVYNVQNEKIFSARGRFTTGNISAAIDELRLDSESVSKLDEYYTLSGIKVKANALKRGIYIHRQADKVEKVVIN